MCEKMRKQKKHVDKKHTLDFLWCVQMQIEVQIQA